MRAGHGCAEQAVVDLHRNGERTEPLIVDRSPPIGEPAEHQEKLVDRGRVEPRHPAGGPFDARNVV